MSDHPSSQVLTCRNLAVGYKGQAVLSDLNLAFAPGHFIALLGPNGAGKTTLLRTLSRHLAPLAGHIDVLGQPLATRRAMDLARIMAVVLTDKVSPPLFSVFEFVALGRYPHTDFLGRLEAADYTAVENALRAVHAEALAERPFADLSDGERQKALVARALAQQPRLMLLDEPTAHLDFRHRVEVMAILRDLCRKQKITVVASLHDVDVAAKVADRVALIKGGKLAGWGPPEKVLSGTAVAQLYDFDGAAFNHHLGSVELRGSGHRGRAFVVAGMGCGSTIYRMLAKQGLSIATGVLHTNDLDYFVASALGAQLTSLPPMTPINGASLAAAAQRLQQCDVVIDSGFQTTDLNAGNLELLAQARHHGKPVFTMRAATKHLTSSECAREVRCRDLGHLHDALSIHFDSVSNMRNSIS